MNRKIFIVIISFFISMSCSFTPKEVDKIFKNGKVYTLDKDNTISEAIAVKDGKIEAVGSNDEILKSYKSNEIIDLNGKYVFPGFIDSHGHILGFGISLYTLNCSDAKSPEEIAEKVRERAKNSKPGEWIVGRGWDQNLWKNKKFPFHDILDEAAPDNPVYLIRKDGHAIWVNVNSMILAGITDKTVEPKGGKILRKNNGEPAGVFLDAAISLIEKIRPGMNEEQRENAILQALNHCAEIGLTQVHDMGVDSISVKIYKKLIDMNKMPIRVCAYIEGEGDLWEKYKKSGREVYGQDFLTINGIKLFVDGALGSRGAALVDEYSDDPGNRGLTMISENELVNISKSALENNLQVAVHCIGDRANNIALNSFEKALNEIKKDDARFRVEHAQVLLPDDISRFKKLKVIPSMQPFHAVSDMYWAESRLGKNRIKYAYAWKSLLNTGAIIPSGSDFPVEDPNPLLGFYAAITRKNVSGIPESWSKDNKYFIFSSSDIDTTQFTNGWYTSQKMTREEALKSFTIWGSYAAFQEKIKGTIEPKKYADFVILSDNILTAEPERVLKTQIEMTIVGGKIVFKKI